MSVDPYPGVEQAQAWDATLQALADLTTSANTAPYFTDIDQAALMTVTPFGRSLIAQTDGDEFGTLLGLGTMAYQNHTYVDIEGGNVEGLGNLGALYAGFGGGGILAGTPLYVAGNARITGDLTVLNHGSFGVNLTVGNTLTVTGGYVGIGVAPGAAPLTFATAIGQKIHLYASGNIRYGLAIAGSQLQIFAEQEAAVHLGHMSHTDGTTFTSRFDVYPTYNYSAQMLGIQKVPVHALDVNGYGKMSGIGLGTVDPVGSWAIRTGGGWWSSFGGNVGILCDPSSYNLQVQGTFYASGASRFNSHLVVGDQLTTVYLFATGWGAITGPLRIGDTVYPGATLDVNGKSVFRDLVGISYGTDPGFWLRCPSAHFDSTYVGGQVNMDSVNIRAGGYWAGPAGIGRGGAGGWSLCVGNMYANGEVQVDNLYARSNAGFGYAPVAGLSIRAGQSHFDAAGFGYAGGSGYYIRAGSTYVDSFWSGTHVIAGSYVQAATYLSCWGAIDTRWAFVNWSSSYFNGTSEFHGVCGFGGYPPDASYSVRGSSCYFDTAAGTNHIAYGTMYVGGTSHLASYVGANGTPDSRFGIRCYIAMYCDGVPYNPGGGPWVAYSDERMKHNIHPILRPLETMCALHGICYEYNDTLDGKPAGVRMGVIAQEVEEVLPQWVGELSGFKTTKLSQFEALTIESIKVLAQRLEALEQKG